MAAIIAATAAVLQAIFAGLVFWFIVKQTGISKKQAEIMEGQKELSQKIDESNKFAAMLNEYASLSDSRRLFWDNLNNTYTQYRVIRGIAQVRDMLFRQEHSMLPHSLDLLIQSEGFPSNFDPSEVNNLLKFVEAHESNGDWGHLWKFARLKYPCEADLSSLDPRNAEKFQHLNSCDFDKARQDLAYFWSKWAQLLDPFTIRESGYPDWKELVMLTWLELALVRRTKDSGCGKIHLFKLAKAEWKFFKKSADWPPDAVSGT